MKILSGEMPGQQRITFVEDEVGFPAEVLDEIRGDEAIREAYRTLGGPVVEAAELTTPLGGGELAADNGKLNILGKVV